MSLDDASTWDHFRGLVAAASGTRTLEDAVARECRSLALDAGAAVPPHALKPLAASLGATVVQVQAEHGPSGRLTRATSGAFKIEVKESQGWRRKRFTISHEIGHLILLRRSQGDRKLRTALESPDYWSSVERVCDYFAAEILMPKAGLIDDLRAKELGPDRIFWLYDRYLVSWQALMRRLVQVSGGSGIGFWTRGRTRRGPVCPRLTDWYASEGVAFVPRGISSSRLTPDLITRAFAGLGSEDAVLSTLRLPSGVLIGPSRAFVWEYTRQPVLFEGYRVRDEVRVAAEVVSLHGQICQLAEPRLAFTVSQRDVGEPG